MLYAIKHYFYVMADNSYILMSRSILKFSNTYGLIKNLYTQFICVAKNLLSKLCEYGPRIERMLVNVAPVMRPRAELEGVGATGSSRGEVA